MDHQFDHGLAVDLDEGFGQGITRFLKAAAAPRHGDNDIKDHAHQARHQFEFPPFPEIFYPVSLRAAQANCRKYFRREPSDETNSFSPWKKSTQTSRARAISLRRGRLRGQSSVISNNSSARSKALAERSALFFAFQFNALSTSLPTWAICSIRRNSSHRPAASALCWTIIAAPFGRQFLQSFCANLRLEPPGFGCPVKGGR